MIVSVVLATIPWLTREPKFVAKQHPDVLQSARQRAFRKSSTWLSRSNPRSGVQVFKEARWFAYENRTCNNHRRIPTQKVISLSSWEPLRFSSVGFFAAEANADNQQLVPLLDMPYEHVLLMGVMSFWATWLLLLRTRQQRRLTLGILAPSLAWAVVQSSRTRQMRWPLVGLTSGLQRLGFTRT